MAVQEYVLKNLKKTDFQDNFGNYWVDAAFEGFGEPVKWVVKDPTKLQEGETYRGEIKELVSKQGKPYNRFYREKPQEGAEAPQPAQTASKPDEAYWQSKNDHIKAQWAIGQAIKLQTAFATQKGDPALLRSSEVEDAAKYLFAMVDRVAGSTSVAEEQPETGYEKAKKVAEELDAKKLATSLDNGEPFPVDTTDYSQPINLEDIPF